MPKLFAPGTLYLSSNDAMEFWSMVADAPSLYGAASQEAFQTGETAIWHVTDTTLAIATDYAAAENGALSPGVTFGQVMLVQRGYVQYGASAGFEIARTVTATARPDDYLDASYDAASGSSLVWHDLDGSNLTAGTTHETVPNNGRDPEGPDIITKTTVWYDDYVLLVQAAPATDDDIHDRFVITGSSINTARAAIWGTDWLPTPSTSPVGVVRVGTNAEDVLTGGPGDDVLRGRGNGDRLDGGDGHDIASYADSPERVIVSLTTGTARGGDATGDIMASIEGLEGSAFGDRLSGDSAANTLLGGDGSDVLRGRGGADILNGGDGLDMATYDDSYAAVNIDLMAGTAAGGHAAGDSLISIEDLTGSRYNDRLSGDAGDNRLLGGEGDDILRGRGGNDEFNGGGGFDRVSYDDAPSGVVASLTTGFGHGGQALNDRYFGINGLEGSAFDDRLAGDARANTLVGGGGDDLLRGRGGADSIDGGSGFDIVSYADSRAGVLVSLMTGTSLRGDAQGDILTDIEALEGSAHADTFSGDNQANDLSGLGGADALRGRGGADTLLGGSGADRFVYGAVSDSGTVSATRDTILDFSQAEGDRIDLSEIDAMPGAGGHQAFTFLGAAAFTGAAGQLRTEILDGDTFIYGDVNGDGIGDISIRLAGSISLNSHDFLL